MKGFDMTMPVDIADPIVSVLIVNYNSGVRLGRTLDCLEVQTFRRFETIVLDNDSKDESADSAKAHRLKPWLIRSDSNLGFAAGNNRAARIARGSWLACLNPDAYPRPDWLERLMAATVRYPDVEAFGSTQLVADDSTLIDGAGDVFHALGIPYRGHFGWSARDLPPEGECFSPCAAAALYRKARFDALGGFDERFFCYGEDVDLGFRLRLAGGRAVQVADAVVLHEGSGISGRHSDFTLYHGHRNRIWAGYKSTPGLIYWPLWPARRLVDLYLLARARGHGFSDPFARALRDGYRGLSALREDRRKLLGSRRGSVADIARAMTWAPWKISRRSADIKPVASRVPGKVPGP